MSAFANLPAEPAAAALELCRRGYAVFPCSATTKRPLTKHGFHDASKDEEQVVHWWRQYNKALIGLPTGEVNNLLVLDVDTKAGDVDEVIEQLEQECDARFRGPRVATLHHGRHVYFSDDARIRIGAGRFRPGVDWRGRGGYVIAPDGCRYHLVADGDFEPAPEPLIGMMLRAQGAAPALVAKAGGLSLTYEKTLREWADAAVTEGSRHEGMLRVVLRLIKRGLPVDEMLALAPLFPQPENDYRTAVLGAYERLQLPLVVTDPADEPLLLAPYDQGCLAGIPPRRWIYAHYLIRSYVSVLGAPGGVGKTALATSVALSVASGKPLLGQKVHERGAVIFANLEDPIEEMQRRVGAAMMLHGVTQEDIGDRLLLLSGRDQSLIVAENTRDRVTIATPVVDRCIEAIKQRQAVLFIADPFVATHAVEENRNEQVNFAFHQWRRIAGETDASIWLPHHFRKGGVSGDQDAFRGASALVDGSRAAVSLSPMDAEEAAALGIKPERRTSFIRLDNAKLNIAPKPEEAAWYELVSVTLPNGDHVQAARAWDKSGVFADFGIELVNLILDDVAEQTPPYSPAVQADRWVGYCVIRHAASWDIDLEPQRARAIVGAWIKTGCLYITDEKDSKRQMRKAVRVNPLKRPGAEP
jgi:hypothetical protein